MNMDDLLDKMEDHPVRFIVLAWLTAGLLSLVSLVIAVLVIVAILNGFGVL